VPQEFLKVPSREHGITGWHAHELPGTWRDHQLVPRRWLEVATRRFVRADGATPNDYGYTFWIMDEVDGVPRDAFSTHGDRLNDSYVVPSLDPPERAKVRNELLQKIVAALRK